MHESTRPSLLFLCYESPWPTDSGAALRTWGLLQALSKVFAIELVVLSRKPLTDEQTAQLRTAAQKITRVPMRSGSVFAKGRVATRMLVQGLPYHCAIIEESFQQKPDVLQYIRTYPGVVYASLSHWGTLIRQQHAPSWILDQQNADIDFWRIYAAEVTGHPFKKLVALLNWRLAARFFPQLYRKVGRIVSVCQSDQELTLAAAPTAQVDVIENGIDCTHYVPNRSRREDLPRILFTGTSQIRNMRALHQFAQEILPLVHRQLPTTELLVGGNFSAQAQSELSHHRNLRFTGRVPDMRPIFDQSDVYIAPFQDAYGSKLKIAEAMAMAIPIVTTPAGMRGFPLVDGSSVLVGHSNEQFADHIVALLRDPAQRERLGTAGREVALASIDWQILGRRLVTLVDMTMPNDRV